MNNQTARTRVRSYSKTLFRAEGGRHVAWNGAGFHFRLFFPGFFPSPLSLASRDFPFFFDGSFSFNPASRSVVFFKSPLPVASPLPPEDSAAAFFSAISASSFFVKKRPPAPRSRRCAWLCLDSCRYGFRDLMSLVLQNKKVSRQYASKCYG